MRTREQERALFVYGRVTTLDPSLREDYKILAKDLGANIMRSGLCASLAFIHRNVKASPANGRGQDRSARSLKPRERAATVFLEHLADALRETRISVFAQALQGQDLFASVRELDLDDYMLATREILRLAIWFRRAVDTFEDPPEQS